MQAAPPTASLLQRIESWRLPRPDARRIINLSIAVLSLLVIVLAARTGWRSWLQYEQATRVALVDAVTSDFITAAGFLELERTYGSALLGRERPDAGRLRQLHRAHSEGDVVWRRAMARARSIAQRAPQSEDLRVRLASAETSFRELGAARRRLEACLRTLPCALGDDAWQQAVSRAVADSAAAREAVYFSIDAPERPARLYAAVQRSTWTLSEHTRRVRGLMEFYLSADKTPTASARAELESESAVARAAQESLRVFARLHRLDGRVRSAIERSDASLSAHFTPLLAAILSGQLHPDGQAWLTDTAPSILALDGLSTAVEEVVAGLAADAMRESRNDMLFNGLFAALACMVAALSVTKVRQTANALFHQKELAEVTIRSIGDAVITTDGLGRVEYINPAAEQMTGWRSSEARGLPLERVFEVVNGLTLEPQTNPIATCLKENRVVSLDNNTVLVSRDGVRRYIEDSAAPIRDQAGALVGGVLVFYDATEV
ncbi:MAG TPA: PAS domain-containing protein, partial [Steroidobacteraceae bacterium]|nr:PAS domain-containing protein [Steroidobacteraceae bacterium]